MNTKLYRGRIVTNGNVSCAMQAWRFRSKLHATVVVKATFTLIPGGKVVPTAPAPIVQEDRTFGGHPVRSVQYALETAPSLPKCDVIFNGHAYGGGKPTTAVKLAIYRESTALVEKTVHVFGDRDAAGNHAPFERIPLVYERACGGPGVGHNPVGSDKPNLLDAVDPQKPSCFAPVSRTWPARKRLLTSLGHGAFPAHSLGAPGAIIEVPAAMPWAYFQAAPPDQQCEYLRGDEWVVLDGVHPSHPRIVTQLMGAVGAARVRSGINETPIELAADMLIIDGDRLTCSIVWRGEHEVPNEEALASLVVLAGLELPGQSIDWEKLAARANSASAATNSMEAAEHASAGETMRLSSDNLIEATAILAPGPGETVAISADGHAAGIRPVTPFAISEKPSGGDKPSDNSATPWARGEAPLPVPDRTDNEAAGANAEATLVLKGSLIEAPGSSAATLVTAAAQKGADKEASDKECGVTSTLRPPSDAAARPVLPFVPGEVSFSQLASEAQAGTAPVRERTPRLGDTDEVGTGTIAPWVKNAAPVLPFPSAAATAAQTASAPIAIEPIGFYDLSSTPRKSLEVAVDVPIEVNSHTALSPPAMIGPLAKPVMLEARAEASPPKGQPASTSKAEEVKNSAPPPEPEEPSADLTLELTAVIAAEIAEGQTESAKILEMHGLTEGAWKANERRWNKALEEEPSRGKSALRGTYDAAYVARVEKFRGQITVAEYARITVGVERGKANEVLEGLKIQRPALMPIVRVWTKKLARDMKLGQEAKQALREAKRA